MTHIAEQAADAIIHLINSRVQSPTRAELAAIIDGHYGGGGPVAKPGEGSAIAARRAEWSRLRANWAANVAVSGSMMPDAPGEKEAMAKTSAAYDLVRELERTLCQRRATSWCDVSMLGDILFANLYQTLPDGLYDTQSDAALKSGPIVQGDEIEEIIAILLRAIRDVTIREARHG